MPKCRLRREIKDFIVFIFVVAVLVGLFPLFCISVGWFLVQMDVALFGGYVESALDYYFRNGLGAFFILIVIGFVLFIGYFLIEAIRVPIKYFWKKGLSWKSIKDIFLECE